MVTDVSNYLCVPFLEIILKLQKQAYFLTNNADLDRIIQAGGSARSVLQSQAALQISDAAKRLRCNLLFLARSS